MKLNKEKVISAIQKVDGLIRTDYYLNGECCALGACLVDIGWEEKNERFDDINGCFIGTCDDALNNLIEEFGGNTAQWSKIQIKNDRSNYDSQLARKESVIQFVNDMPEAE